MVHDPDEDINKYYEITERTLGQGTFSKVKEGIDRESKQKVAIKIVYKEHVSAKPDMLRNEVEILLKIDHPNVIKLIDLFDTEQRLYLVMELVTGGELFDKIVEREQYSEADAKEVMRQLFDAIEYIHSQDVVHRDLKPENLLLEDESTSTRVKLSDFGLSRIFDDSSMNTACGTPGYVAPEILRAQGYNSSVDMWSAGVIMYILLCGYPPFYNENDAKLFESIMSAAYHFHSPFWDNISKEAKDLIRALLVVDPAKRLTATQAKEAEWFKIAGNTQTKPLPSQLREKLEQHNKDRKSYIELKQEKKGN
uniref:Protein kinase domain-containing protein n=1 Tax=Arcella intermedia TaxID=1963864 RepID=A0A6B2LAP7_9EUKA